MCVSAIICVHLCYYYLYALLLFSFTAQKITAAHVGVNTRGAFRMAIWLTVYYDFFDKKVRQLCNAIVTGFLIPHSFRKSQSCYAMPLVEKNCLGSLRKVT